MKEMKSTSLEGGSTPSLTAKERGATAIVICALLFGLMGAVALAIDVGSWYQRSSQLQKAADAAVLSGVATKVEGNNVTLAEQRAREIIAQNGIDLNEEITLANGTKVKRIKVEIVHPRDDQYQVLITDRRMDVYFGRAVGLDALSRSSTAQLNVCTAECYQKVDIPKPHLALNTTGSGDGYLPIYVEGDSRLFAINHKVNSGSNTASATAQQLICIDRFTNAVCAGYPRSLQTAAGNSGTSGSTNVFTNNRVAAVVVGRKIYVGAQGTVGTKSYFGINCWNTANDTSCGFAPLAELAKGSGTYPNRGGGPVLVNGKLYAVTDNGKIHCVNPSDLSYCAGYGTSSGTGSYTSGVNTALKTATPAYPDYVMSQNSVDQPLMPIDHELIGQKIFWTMHYRTQKWTSGALSGQYVGSLLHCWDVATGAPCSGFGVKVLPWRLDTTAGGDGSVFVRYNTGLVGEGVCVMKMGAGYKCYGVNGSELGSLTSALHTKFSNNLERYGEFYLDGRTYFAGQYNLSEVYCWNWATATSCGNQNWKTSSNSPLYNSAILSQPGDR